VSFCCFDVFAKHKPKERRQGSSVLLSVVENRRLSSGKTAQRTVLYLGEINDQQEGAWRKSLEVFDDERQSSRSLSLFPEDRGIPADAVDSLQVKLSGLQLRRARPFGNCWLACDLWRQLGLDSFWQDRLPDGREAISWEKGVAVAGG
jgi:hypothetical protein